MLEKLFLKNILLNFKPINNIEANTKFIIVGFNLIKSGFCKNKVKPQKIIQNSSNYWHPRYFLSINHATGIAIRDVSTKKVALKNLSGREKNIIDRIYYLDIINCINCEENS